MRLFSSTAPSTFAGSGLFIASVMASFCACFLGACSSNPEVQEVLEEPVELQEPFEVDSELVTEDLGSAAFDEDPFAEDPFAEAEVEPEITTAVEPEITAEPQEGSGELTTTENVSPEAVEQLSVSQEPVVQEPVAQEPAIQEPAVQEEVHFSEDPMDDPDVEVVGRAADALKSKEEIWAGTRPESQLVEIEAAPEPDYDEDLIKQNSELNLACLQARLVADELSREAKVMVPDGIRTFGELLPVVFHTRNPFGDSVELIPPTTGLLLELDWTVTRWLPLEGSDSMKRHRYFRLSQWFLLEADQNFREYTDLPLELEGDAGSVWIVEVDARIRCAGAIYLGKPLPVHEIEFAAARFLVLPPGWEQFEEDPLASLERVLAMPNGQVDRHVLVCVALLRGEDRFRGVDLLVDGLRNAPNNRRRLSITQALQWLTGLQLGSLPEDWLKWAKLRKISSARDGSDHESTPGNPTTK